MIAAAMLLAAGTPPPHHDGLPLPARHAFATSQYGLTFRVPAHATYCPLPKDWVGSDHGTTLFLVPPRRCAGDAGYPSSSRGFRPADTPRIDVFYAYDLGEDEVVPVCHRAGTAPFLGRSVPLCREQQDRLETLTVTSRYPLGQGSDGTVSITLTTVPARRAADLGRFRALVASTRTCSSLWHGEDTRGRRNGPDVTTGTGPRCPAAARWF